MTTAFPETFSPPMSTNENGNDREKQLDIVVPEPPDIEHVNVQDDPRAWSANRKVRTALFLNMYGDLPLMSFSDHYPTHYFSSHLDFSAIGQHAES